MTVGNVGLKISDLVVSRPQMHNLLIVFIRYKILIGHSDLVQSRSSTSLERLKFYALYIVGCNEFNEAQHDTIGNWLGYRLFPFQHFLFTNRNRLVENIGRLNIIIKILFVLKV